MEEGKMTSITQSQAEYFSQPELAERAYLSCNSVCHILNILDFVPVKGHGLAVVNYATPGAAGTVDTSQATPPLADGATALSAPVTYPISRIAGEVDITEAFRITSSQVRDVLGSQVDGKKRAIRNEFCLRFVEGSGSNGEMLGLRTAVSANQTIGPTNGGPLTFALLDDLLELVRPYDEESDRYLLMHYETFKAYRALCYGSGFAPPMIEHHDLDLWPAHGDVPIVISNFLPTNEERGSSGATTTSVYAFIGGSGPREEEAGVVGIYPGTNAKNEILVKGPIQATGVDADYYHVYWDVGVALLRECALARLAGILNP